MKNINWDSIRARLREALLTLPHFLKNPVQGIRTLPDWDWPTILILQGAFAAACAVLANLVHREIFRMITGLVIAPVSSYLILLIFAGFFYYTFLLFFKREVGFRQIYLHLIFAGIPSQLTILIYDFVPPIISLGVAASLYLFFISCTDVFLLERKNTRQLLAGLFALYAFFWVMQLVQRSSKHDRLRQKATPESLDILEKELNFEND